MSERAPPSPPAGDRPASLRASPRARSPSRTPTEPPPTTVPAVETPSAPADEPRPVLRLSVELRVAGMVATLWWVGLAHAWAWSSWAGTPWRTLEQLPWLGLVAPQVLALALVLGNLFRDLPRVRWARRRRTPRQRDPRPWLLLGFPALPLAPLLWLRDRRARALEPSPDEVEAAFGRALAVESGARFPDAGAFWEALGRAS